MRIPHYIGLFALLAAGVAAGWGLRGCGEAEPAGPVAERAAIDTTDADRPVTAEDTATTKAAGASPAVARASTPREVVRYQTVTDTVRDCYVRPSGFDVRGLAGPRPLRVDPGGFFSDPSVTLTTFDPAASRIEQRIYEIPEPTWELWPDVGGEYGPRGFAADALVHLRRRRVHAWGGYRVAEMRLPAETRLLHGPTAGLRLRPFTLDW